MGKINSKKKGAAGELEWSKVLQEAGFDARRSQQYCGVAGDADVLCPALSNYHFEVKRVENLNLQQAFDKAEEDKHEHQTSVIAHRRNHKPWLVTMSADTFISLVKKLDGI